MIEAPNKTTSYVEFENTVCPICAYHENHLVYAFKDKFGSYDIVRCERCHFSFLNARPTPSTISIYYAADQYTPFLSSVSDSTLFGRIYTKVRKYSVRWKRKKIEKLKHGNSLLDIGCGTGEFLFEMKSRGWKVSGLEPSRDASEFARKTYQLDVQTGFIDHESLVSSAGKFDVITMWHVLEHIHNPLEALESIRELLSEEGLLVIALPNISSFDAGVYGKDWIALDVPRHLLHFVPETLSATLKKTGMEIIEQHQMPLDTVFNCLMSEKKIIDQGRWFAIPFYTCRMVVSIIISWVIGLNSKKGSSVMYYIRKT